MKVTLPKDYRKYYTLEDVDRAKAIIKSEKESDDFTAKDYAEMAIREALKDKCDCISEILKAEATTAKNGRIWNAYNETSEDMDIWIEAIAKTSRGFIEVGAYVTDIWQAGATPFMSMMFIEYFKRADL